MTMTNEDLIAEARKREAEWGSRDSLPSDVWLVVRLADALAAVPAPTEADRRKLTDILYSHGVASNLIPEYQADSIAEIVDAILPLLAPAPKTQDGGAREEYGIFRKSGVMMDGGPGYSQVVNATFRSLQDVKDATRRVPSLRDMPITIQKRVAPGPWMPISLEGGK